MSDAILDKTPATPVMNRERLEETLCSSEAPQSKVLLPDHPALRG
jgi:hypothetical protein